VHPSGSSINMANPNPFDTAEIKAIYNMIQDALSKTLAPTLKTLIDQALTDVLAKKQSETPPPASQQTSTYRPQRQLYTKPTSMSEKQTLFLMHTTERILAKTYELHKYNTYSYFLGTRTPREINGITYRYLKTTFKKDPTDDETKNIEHQKTAINNHIKNAHTYIKQEQQAAAKMLSFLDCTHQNIINSINEAITKGTNNTLYIKNNAHKDTYLFVANATIQKLHDELKSNCNEEDYINFENYITISKQINTLKRKIDAQEEHFNKETIPTHLQQFQLQWHGLPLSEKHKKAWEEAHINIHQHMHETTTEILKEQLTELKEKLAQTKITDTTDNTEKVKAIIFINKHRQASTTTAESTKSFPIPTKFGQIMHTTITKFKYTLELANLFIDKTILQPSTNNIVNHLNYTQYIVKPTLNLENNAPTTNNTTTTTNNVTPAASTQAKTTPAITTNLIQNTTNNTTASTYSNTLTKRLITTNTPKTPASKQTTFNITKPSAKKRLLSPTTPQNNAEDIIIDDDYENLPSLKSSPPKPQRNKNGKN